LRINKPRERQWERKAGQAGGAGREIRNVKNFFKEGMGRGKTDRRQTMRDGQPDHWPTCSL